MAAVAGLEAEVRDAIAAFDLRRAARHVAEAVAALNRDLEETRPWAVARDPGRAADLDTLLACHVATARCIATAAAPIVPDLSGHLLDRLRGTPRLPAPAPAFARLEAG